MKAFFQQKIDHIKTDLMRSKEKLMPLYQKYERFLPLIFFAYGFTSDSFFLKVDSLMDHLFLLTYTVLAGCIILLLGLIQTGQAKDARILKYRKYYPLALQFFMGNLFSAYVVYYFKSAAVGQSIIFLGLLFVLLVANEFLGDRLTNITLLCTLYFFITFAFLTFSSPFYRSVSPVPCFIQAVRSASSSPAPLYLSFTAKFTDSTRKKSSARRFRRPQSLV